MRSTFTAFFVLIALISTPAQTLNGPPPNGGGVQNICFELVAAKNVEIHDFEIEFIGIFGGTLSAGVWRKIGYGGYATALGDPHSWELLGVTSLTYQTGLVPLGLNLNVEIPAGASQAFMIGVPQRMNSSIPTGAVAAQNSDLMLLAGNGSAHWSFVQMGEIADRSFSGKVHYSLLPQHAMDLSLDAVTAPVMSPGTCSSLGVAEFVTVQIRNHGTSVLPAGTLVQIELEVDGSVIVNDPILTATPVSAGGTFPHTFSLTADLSQGFSHNLTATVIVPGDGEPANDALTVNLVAGGGPGRVTTLPFVEDFENPITLVSQLPPLGWYQDPNDSSGLYSQWYLGVFNQSIVMTTQELPPNGLPSSTVGPTGSPYHVRLISPCIDLTQAQNPRLRYFFRQAPHVNLPYNTFSVDVIDGATGLIVTDVDGPLTGHDPEFTGDTRIVDLTGYVGTTIQLVFRADIGITVPGTHPLFDDVVIEEALPTPGQNRQKGLAKFLLDGEFAAQNANGDFPYVESGGPYRIAKSSGDGIQFSFEGPPSQPVIVLSGALNPVAATFPIIGQMDIGGLVDPMTGIPTGINVLADGTSTLGLGPLFQLNALGELDLWFTIPNLPLGSYGTFQVANLTGGVNGSWVALSNAIELQIQ